MLINAGNPNILDEDGTITDIELSTITIHTADQPGL